MERCEVSLHIQSGVQSECGKISTRKTPNMNTFHTVLGEESSSNTLIRKRMRTGEETSTTEKQ